jgi:hypothetical protein
VNGDAPRQRLSGGTSSLGQIAGDVVLDHRGRSGERADLEDRNQQSATLDRGSRSHARMRKHLDCGERRVAWKRPEIILPG